MVTNELFGTADIHSLNKKVDDDSDGKFECKYMDSVKS